MDLGTRLSALYFFLDDGVNFFFNSRIEWNLHGYVCAIPWLWIMVSTKKWKYLYISESLCHLKSGWRRFYSELNLLRNVKWPNSTPTNTLSFSAESPQVIWTPMLRNSTNVSVDWIPKISIFIYNLSRQRGRWLSSVWWLIWILLNISRRFYGYGLHLHVHAINFNLIIYSQRVQLDLVAINVTLQ